MHRWIKSIHFWSKSRWSHQRPTHVDFESFIFPLMVWRISLAKYNIIRNEMSRYKCILVAGDEIGEKFFFISTKKAEKDKTADTTCGLKREPANFYLTKLCQQKPAMLLRFHQTKPIAATRSLTLLSCRFDTFQTSLGQNLVE